MKCSNCGYEIDKPNLKTCPLCGYKIVRKVQVETPSPEITEPKIETLPSDQTVVANVDPSFSIQKDEPKMTPQEPVAPLTVECPGCHLRILVDSNFCPHCGYNMRFKQEDNNKPEETSEPQPESILQSEPEPIYIDEEEPEEHTVQSTPENYRIDEDADEYIENGSYQPYSDEEDEKQEDETEDDATQDSSSSTSWITITVVAIISVLLGAVLYSVIY